MALAVSIPLPKAPDTAWELGPPAPVAWFDPGGPFGGGRGSAWLTKLESVVQC